MFLFWPLSTVVDPPMSRVLSALALHGRHFSGFQQGLLHTRDVFYYLAVTYFFLLLARKFWRPNDGSDNSEIDVDSSPGLCSVFLGERVFHDLFLVRVPLVVVGLGWYSEQRYG
ncbi:MAG: hypothetical protein Ct9H300mP15_27060 [Gemmatimonadota bacterium]|nr:MAG: hypothetical protein Ct9H300mP15_27060 [Gemmatimonadota bacterium]